MRTRTLAWLHGGVQKAPVTTHDMLEHELSTSTYIDERELFSPDARTRKRVRATCAATPAMKQGPLFIKHNRWIGGQQWHARWAELSPEGVLSITKLDRETPALQIQAHELRVHAQQDAVLVRASSGSVLKIQSSDGDGVDEWTEAFAKSGAEVVPAAAA